MIDLDSWDIDQIVQAVHHRTPHGLLTRYAFSLTERDARALLKYLQNTGIRNVLPQQQPRTRRRAKKVCPFRVLDGGKGKE